MLLRLFLILAMVPPVQQPAMHFRVQRFHAPAEHFRPAREFRHISYGTPASRSNFAVPPVERISIFRAASFLANSTIPSFIKHAHAAHAPQPWVPPARVEAQQSTRSGGISKSAGLWEKRTGKIRRTKIRTSRGLSVSPGRRSFPRHTPRRGNSCWFAGLSFFCAQTR